MSKDTLILAIMLALLVLLTVFPLLTRTAANNDIEIISVNLTETNPWVGGCNEVVVKVVNNENTPVRPGILVTWNTATSTFWLISNKTIPPHTTAVLVGYADQSHTMPIGQYASVRVIDLDNPLRDWSNPVWVECNITRPSIIDPFMNNTVYHLAYSIEYPYGWMPILYGTNVETIVNNTGLYAWTGDNTLLILSQGVDGSVTVLVDYVSNCTFYLYILDNSIPLDGSGTIKVLLTGDVSIVIPQDCFVHITMTPSASFITNKTRGVR